MQDFLYDATNPTTELCHYGILGQKWGERRYQNKDGSLTPEGKVRYSWSDKRTETKLRRGIAASKKNLKYKAQKADTKKKFFDEKVEEYEKEQRRFRPFNRSQKKIDVNNALARVNRAEDLLKRDQREVNIARDVYKHYDNAYEDFYNQMTEKYGRQNVREIRRKDFRPSKHYVFENVISPGLTMADISKFVQGRYVNKLEKQHRLTYI